MPKRGGARIRNWRTDDHFEHDDRAITNNTRRVSFKPGTNKRLNKFKSRNDAAKILLDDDVDMGANAGMGGPSMPRKGHFRGRGGRLSSPAPRPGYGMPKKRFIAGLLPWYQIIIPYGAKHEKDVILRSLLSYLSPDVFIPHYYKINGNAAMFYVDDVKIAEKLFHADRKITMSDGFKLVVIVRNTVPNVVVDDAMKEKMKLTMAKRYNAATKALDLTKFHADPELSDIFCALFRPIIMLAAIDIIAENIPDLEALNLNDNKLHGIEHLKILHTKLKNLKILYLGDNRIPFLGSLQSLKSLPLVELYLKGNPLVTRFHDHEIYVSESTPSSVVCLPYATDVGVLFNVGDESLYDAIDVLLELQKSDSSLAMFLMSSDVRKKFPKLVRLDGVDLPPAIGFDVSEDVALPPRQQSFLVDPAGQDLVRDFLTQYFAIYDSESRQQLLEAYHETAIMSMAASYLTNDNRNATVNKLNAYITTSRNIIRITEREGRRRHLRNGRLQVVSFLSDLPKTTHDLMGFAVDLLVFTPAMIVLTMNGMFKETVTSGTPVRSFHRTFVIVPNANGGFSIINDMLFISNPTKEQEDRAFSNSAAPAAAPPPPAAAPPAHDNNNQKMMLTMLGQQTGMNEHWSMNCLQETGWDLQRALFIFNQLQSEGKIPPAAFVK